MPSYGVEESKSNIIEQPASTPLKVAAVAAVMGLLAWVFTYILQHYVLKNMVCGGNAYCAVGVAHAGHIASVMVAIIAVTILVRFAVYRPLLVVLAAVVALWGLSSWLSTVGTVLSVVFTVLAYVFSYSAFAWLARIRNVGVMLMVIAGVIAIARVLAVSL